MMRYAGTRGGVLQRSGAFARRTDGRALNRFDGYQYSLFAPPVRRMPPAAAESEPYAVRAVAPALRPLVRRYGNRCPECTGPLVSGEGCVACPVCGFARQSW